MKQATLRSANPSERSRPREASGEFRPLPFLANPHAQTLVAYFANWPSFRAHSAERQIALPDGDRLVFHDSIPPDWKEGGRIAIVVHGLGGSHRSGHVQRLARRLFPEGFRVIRVDLRGAGCGLPLARRAYHGGCSADIRAVIETLQRECPTSPVTLVGYSLGGNIILKLAGEAAGELPTVTGVAAMAPPIDLLRSIERLELPGNRPYELFFLRDLLQAVRQRQAYFPDMPKLRFPARMTIRLFDEMVTAPSWGYAGALDYYQQCSSVRLLNEIAIPSLIVTSQDDPFVAFEPFQDYVKNPLLDCRLTRHGGHLGFLGWDGSGGIRWAEQKVVEWILKPRETSEASV